MKESTKKRVIVSGMNTNKYKTFLWKRSSVRDNVKTAKMI